MAVPIWPLSLPDSPLIGSYTESYPKQILINAMDYGNKVRLEGHAKPYIADISYSLSAEQVGVLKEFIHNTLREGARAFDFKNPFNGNYIRAALLPSGDTMYTLAPNGSNKHWLFSVKMEFYPYVPV